MQKLNRYIEQTNLSPTVSAKEIDILIKQGITNNFWGICVPPFWVKKAARDLGSSDVQLVTVIGFPLGYNMTQTKIAEIGQALDDGANEIDVVMNISAFKSGMPWVKIELAKCAKIIHEREALMKVIIETAVLSEEEIKTASLLCQDAGTDFVKTSTGFAKEGAKVEHIRLIRATLSSSVGIKASGGIKTYEQSEALIAAGADRIGTSAGIQIMEQNEAL